MGVEQMGRFPRRQRSCATRSCAALLFALRVGRGNPTTRQENENDGRGGVTMIISVACASLDLRVQLTVFRTCILVSCTSPSGRYSSVRRDTEGAPQPIPD